MTADVVPSGFVILKYLHKTPSLATCERCHVKFFTRLELIGGDPQEAERHLREKFTQHICKRTLDEIQRDT